MGHVTEIGEILNSVFVHDFEDVFETKAVQTGAVHLGMMEEFWG